MIICTSSLLPKPYSEVLYNRQTPMTVKALSQKQTVRDALRHPRIHWALVSHHVPSAEAQPKQRKRKHPKTTAYFVEDEYLVTALVPSDTACLASSPGRMRRTLQRKGMLVQARPQCVMMVVEGGDVVVNLRGLDLAGRDGGLLVVGSKLAGLGGDTLEDVVDERVQDGHGAVGDTSVGVNLLEDWIEWTCQRDVFGKWWTWLCGRVMRARPDAPLLMTRLGSSRKQTRRADRDAS